jgi:hypothetical protein
MLWARTCGTSSSGRFRTAIRRVSSPQTGFSPAAKIGYGNPPCLIEQAIEFRRPRVRNLDLHACFGFQPNKRVRVACTFRAVESVTGAQDLLSELLPASRSLSFFFPHPLSDRTSPGQSTLARLSHPLSLLFYACARSSPFSSLHPPRPVPPRASVNMHATFALAALASVASVATAQKQFVPQEITTLTAAFAAGVNGYGRFPCTQVNGDGSFSPRKFARVALFSLVSAIPPC